MGRDLTDGRHEPSDELRTALSASGFAGTWEWDFTDRTARYDRGAAALLAGDPDLCGLVLPSDSAIAAIHPDDLTQLETATRRAAKTDGLFAAEYRVLTPSRGVRWVLSRGRAFPDSRGRPMHCKGILIDDTDAWGIARGDVGGTAARSRDALDRATIGCLDAHRALDEVGAAAPSHLRLALGVVLHELGRLMARRAMM